LKSELRAPEPADKAIATKAAARKSAVVTWGPRDNAHWGRRSELEKLAILGGSVVACADKLEVGRGMLRGWINHPTQKCWIPRPLFAKLDEYLDDLKDVPRGPSPAKSTTETPVLVILDPVLDRESDVVVAASLAHVSLRVSELPNGNRPPVPQGEKAPIACHVKLMPRGESSEFEFGIVEASLVVRISRANHGRFRPAASAPAIPGAEMSSHSTETRLQVDILSEDGKALRLRGIEGPAIVLGDYVGSRVGDEIVVELFVPADHGFAIQPRRGVFAATDVLPKKREAVREQFTKWFLQIPADDIDLKMFSETWRYRRAEDE
jgi:hypothetical protein